MNQKTLFKLEYDKIIALLEKEATSFRGGGNSPPVKADDRYQ